MEVKDNGVKMFYGGRDRICYPVICENCGEEFHVPKHFLGKSKYCSKTCSYIVATTKVSLYCEYCKNVFSRKQSALKNSKSGLQFCSRTCKDLAQQVSEGILKGPSHYKTGKCSYRRKAFNHIAAKCATCGYSENRKMLDVDHIDRNRDNNAIRNLQFLCVWCHALKTRKVPYHDR